MPPPNSTTTSSSPPRRIVHCAPVGRDRSPSSVVTGSTYDGPLVLATRSARLPSFAATTVTWVPTVRPADLDGPRTLVVGDTPYVSVKPSVLLTVTSVF